MRSEFELIGRYFAPLAHGFPGACGLRDDAAVISPASGFELVIKSDVIVGSVDFPPDTAAEWIARKALRVNLSDLAAKGAVPRAYLVDLMLPAAIEEAWIAAFASGLARDQAEYAVHLAGGDLSSTPGPVAVAVTVFGETPSGRIIRRFDARAGDRVYVTGTIGDAALGLEVLRDGAGALSAEAAAFLVDRYRLPRPRVGLGPQLLGLATAAIDVSDGLVADLRQLCEVSGLCGTIEAAAVPLSDAARAALAHDAQRQAAVLGGGDDYEILFTAPAERAARIAALARASGVAITAIGHVATPAAGARSGVRVVDASGQTVPLASEGWTHFGERTTDR
ncbi:MAG: thiamine-phosphate kinase [Gammaproteobacteria bacterium]|nr:thiamine-phosphate kinase [Gammaproteobacteria bacterium]